MYGTEIKHRAPRGSVTREKVAELLAQGKTANQIATALGCTTPPVYSRLKEIRVNPIVAPLTLDSIAAQKRQLEEQQQRLHEQLKQLAANEERLLEAKRLKLNPITFKNVPGVFVSQDGQGMSFRLEDFAELITKGGGVFGVKARTSSIGRADLKRMEET